ncbi:MAG: LytR C-terminal domain-containing protein [Acidimicrobiales bacterium]|nr:LytR C-terminal domain-containing protein [Acidimicrobiales bacterium]
MSDLLPPEPKVAAGVAVGGVEPDRDADGDAPVAGAGVEVAADAAADPEARGVAAEVGSAGGEGAEARGVAAEVGSAGGEGAEARGVAAEVGSAGGEGAEARGVAAEVAPAEEYLPANRRTRRRRPHGLLTLAASLVLAALIPAFAAVGGLTLIDSRDGRTIFLDGSRAVTVLPETPTALLVETAPDGTLSGLTMLALGPSGKGGAVVFVPVGTETALPSGTVDRLAVAYDQGGLDQLREAVEGLLGVRFDLVVPLDERGWTQLVAPQGPVTVELLDPVQREEAPGQVAEVFPAGPNVVQPGDVSGFLATTSVRETELARLTRHEAFWRAWLDQQAATTAGTDGTVVSTTLPVADEPGTQLDLPTFVQDLAAGPVLFVTLPVLVPEAPSADGLDRYEPDTTPIRLLMAEISPGAVVASTGGARVRIVNPTGDPEVLSRLAGQLVFLGVNLIIVGDSADPAPPQTQVVYYGDNLPAAEVLAELLGTGEIAKSDELLEGLDVTIVVGTDLVDRLTVPSTTVGPIGPPLSTAEGGTTG